MKESWVAKQMEICSGEIVITVRDEIERYRAPKIPPEMVEIIKLDDCRIHVGVFRGRLLSENSFVVHSQNRHVCELTPIRGEVF